MIETHFSQTNLPICPPVRQLAFLQCTQSGLFQITDAVTWLPDHQSVAYNQRKCEDILGAGYRFDHLLRANAALATRYGSQYQSVTRVLYTNGMIDPWFTHGIVYSRDPSTTVLNIERKRELLKWSQLGD